MPDAVYELNETTLQEINQSDASDTVKVLNLVKVLRQKVTDEGTSQPFLVSIGERAEAAIAAYENRQSGTQDTLAEFMRLASEYASAARDSKTKSDLDNNTLCGLYNSQERYSGGQSGTGASRGSSLCAISRLPVG